MKLQYGRLLTRSWRLALDHPRLWILGLFAGGGGFSGGGNFGNLGNLGNRGQSASGGPSAAHQWIQDNVGLVVLLALALVVVVVLLVILSTVCQQALGWGALTIDAGFEPSLGVMWHEGRARFWRYVRVGLVQGLIAILSIGPPLLVALAGIGLLVNGNSAGLAPLLVGGVLVLVAVIVVGLGLSWTPYLLVLREFGARDTVRASWALFRAHKTDTFLLQLTITLIVGAALIPLFLLSGLLAIPGVVLAVAGRSDPTMLALGIVIAVVLGGGMAVVGSAFLNTFAWSYRAMACRDLAHLSGMLTPAAAPA
ncbi:MAG: hypothetical protein ACYDAY_09900 [Candidatus Dormibacteria bacterium]